MNDPRSIPAEDLALYAMQALSADEMAAVEAVLHQSPDARAELAQIQGDLALLGLSAEQHAVPAGSFARLQARMHETTTATAKSVPAAVTEQPAPVIAMARRSKWPIITPWAIAAVLAIACILLGTRIGSLNEALNGDNTLVANLAAKASRAQQVLEVLNAPNAQRVTLSAAKTPPSPTAHTVYLPDRGALIMQADNLKPVPAGKTYELWVIPASGAAPVAAGTFTPNAQGFASVVLPRLPSGVAAKAFGITVENEGGASAPTMPIVLSGE